MRCVHCWLYNRERGVTIFKILPGRSGYMARHNVFVLHVGEGPKHPSLIIIHNIFHVILYGHPTFLQLWY